MRLPVLYPPQSYAVGHHCRTMAELRKHETPEEAHLAEQERLLAELADRLATKETEFATTGAEPATTMVMTVWRRSGPAPPRCCSWDWC